MFWYDLLVHFVDGRSVWFIYVLLFIHFVLFCSVCNKGCQNCCCWNVQYCVICKPFALLSGTLYVLMITLIAQDHSYQLITLHLISSNLIWVDFISTECITCFDHSQHTQWRV